MAAPNPYRYPVAKEYAMAQWTLIHANGSYVNTTFSQNDPELHTKVLVFPYNYPDDAGTVTIFASYPYVRYDNVPFCRLPPRVKKFAAVCTQNLVTNKKMVLDWVAWHLSHGFDRAVLYVNEPYGSYDMAPILSTAMNKGFLLLVDWAWPIAFAFHDQVATHTSCLWRAKGRFDWLGLNDLDEVFLPGKMEKVADILHRYEPDAGSFGAIACCNLWVDGRPGIENLNRCAKECLPWPKNQKCIVRVENVDYFCIHKIMLGLPERRLDASELVNAHRARGRGKEKKSHCSLVDPFKPVLERWITILS
jgi:hypothetical protein